MGIRLLLGILGSFLVLSTTKYFTEKYRDTKIVKVLARIGTMTLGIYCLQVFFAEGLLKSLQNTLGEVTPLYDNIFVYDCLFTPLVSVLIIFICIAVIKLLKKYEITRFLFLGDN